MVAGNSVITNSSNHTGNGYFFDIRLQKSHRYDTYYNFDLERSVPNYAVPRIGRTVRVTDPLGKPIILGHKRVRSGKFRIQYSQITFEEQLVESFKLFDLSIHLLEKVFFRKILIKSNLNHSFGA